jgi:hypothetical protein
MILDRIEFAHGDRLMTADLQQADVREAALHALHVRAVHRAWGIALGFAVVASADLRAVLVGPGLAYDRCGAAILLTDAVRIPLPAGDGEHRLAVAAGPRWCWDAGALEVARVVVAGGLASGAPDTSGRALAVAAPRMAAGTLTVPQTGAVRASAQVDTSRAAFLNTPYYFAQPVGERAGEGYEPGALEPLLVIRDERPDGFRLDVYRLGRRRVAGVPVPVAWLGVEPVLTAPVPVERERLAPRWCG